MGTPMADEGRPRAAFKAVRTEPLSQILIALRVAPRIAVCSELSGGSGVSYGKHIAKERQCLNINIGLVIVVIHLQDSKGPIGAVTPLPVRPMNPMLLEESKHVA